MPQPFNHAAKATAKSNRPWSLIRWRFEPKAAHYGMKRFKTPVIATLFLAAVTAVVLLLRTIDGLKKENDALRTRLFVSEAAPSYSLPAAADAKELVGCELTTSR